ncbi:MAG: ABC transporter permease [Chitinophagaceae bacterium]|nr:ABC transporter permease [Chitinophagaceae bacterium]
MAGRSLKKDGVFSIINIVGLALGLAVCLLISLFVIDELSYDRYNDKADRIFRVVSDIHINGNGNNSVFTPSPMGPALVKDYPAIQAAVRIRPIQGGVLVRKGADTWMESNAVLADPSLFDVFTLPLLAGDRHTALAAPNSLVISASLAEKYFNSIQVIGKTLRTDDDTTSWQITGVIKDMPTQSHLHLKLIKSLTGKKFNTNQAWFNLYGATYLLARPNTSTADIDLMLAGAVTRYIDPQMRQQLHNTPGDMEKKGNYFRFYSMPLTHIHLYSNVMGEFEPNGNIRTVYIFIVLALLILLVACVNFMNLSTARSARRSREVGVRKVLGGSRRELITQFLVEAILTSFMALSLAVVIAVILLPYFNQLSGKFFSLAILYNRWTVPALLMISLTVGLLAGSYPAFFLSAFQPLQVLKGRLVMGLTKSRLRNGLVVFQFAIAIVLVASTIVIYHQLHYIQTRQLGYDREQVLTIRQTKYLGDHARTFKQLVEALPGVVSGTMTGYLPNMPQPGNRVFFKDAGVRVNESFLMGDWRIDADYISTLKMEIVAGRNFSSVIPTDSAGVLINETAAQMLGYADPIGKSIFTGPDPVTPYRILGVVKDFNAHTLHSKIEPIIFSLRADRNAFAFRLHTKDLSGLIARIKRTYTSMDEVAGQPFVYSFLDDDFNALYASDKRTGSLFIAFTILSLVIACLGLFGMVSYAAEQRAKEIGIRRILGAGIRHIVVLFSQELFKLIFLAACIGFPLAWWGMHRWLEDFAYRTPVSGWAFVLAGSGVATIALVTVGLQAIKAAVVNPVERLRTE